MEWPETCHCSGLPSVDHPQATHDETRPAKARAISRRGPCRSPAPESSAANQIYPKLLNRLSVQQCHAWIDPRYGYSTRLSIHRNKIRLRDTAIQLAGLFAESTAVSKVPTTAHHPRQAQYFRRIAHESAKQYDGVLHVVVNSWDPDSRMIMRPGPTKKANGLRPRRSRTEISTIILHMLGSSSHVRHFFISSAVFPYS